MKDCNNIKISVRSLLTALKQRNKFPRRKIPRQEHKIQNFITALKQLSSGITDFNFLAAELKEMMAKRHGDLKQTSEQVQAWLHIADVAVKESSLEKMRNVVNHFTGIFNGQERVVDIGESDIEDELLIDEDFSESEV